MRKLLVPLLLLAASTALAKPPVNAPPRRAPPPKVKRPDPNVVYSVPIDGDPVSGKATAKVTIVEAEDFMCPFCQKADGTLAALEKSYGDDVRVVFKNFVVHPQAKDAHLAACAAGMQGKFFEFAGLIWTKGFHDHESVDDLRGFAKDLGLDMKKFDEDRASTACADDLANDQHVLSALGVMGTPTFYINGKIVEGAQSEDTFRKAIDEAKARADKAIADGVKPEEYYQKKVVEGGQRGL